MSSAISKFPSTRSLYPGSGQQMMAAPDVTLTIRRSQRGQRASEDVTNTQTSDPDTRPSDQSESRANVESDSEQKETIYESLNNFNTELSLAKDAKSGLKEEKKDVVVVNNERDDLYAKVKKLSSTSDKSNCSNLNSDFVSIYELTKVETLNNSKSDEREENPTNNNVYKASPALVRPQDSVSGQGTLSPKTLMREKSNPDFSFALDFSPKREINKVSFASFQPDTDDDNIVDGCDNNDNAYHYPTDDEEDEDEVNFRSKESLINSNRSSYNMHSSNIDNSQVQNDSIPKVQLNMFIQKDAKQSGGKKWPKVETPFCRENKINEVFIMEFYLLIICLW